MTISNLAKSQWRNSINRTHTLLSKSMKGHTAASERQAEVNDKKKIPKSQNQMQPQESLEVGECVCVCLCACGGGEIPTGESCYSACMQYIHTHTHTYEHRAQNACYFTFNTSRGACTINRLVDKPTTRKPTAHFGPNRERNRERERETVCVGEQDFECMRAVVCV